MEEYPESRYSKDVMDIFQKTDKFLKAAIPESKIIN
jgi:hypothetical protein